MTEPLSLIVDKDLMEGLKRQICQESISTSRDDKFCGSDPAKWPTGPLWPSLPAWPYAEGSEKVRLAYPEDKQSLPGPVEFCDAYMNWHMQSRCDVLPKELAVKLEAANYCVVSSNFDALVKKYLRYVPRKRRSRVKRMMRQGLANLVNPYIYQCDQVSLVLESVRDSVLDRCEILFDETETGSIFNPERPKDLRKIADNFCLRLQQEELKKSLCQQAQGTGPKPGTGENGSTGTGGDGSTWWGIAIGGGGVVALSFIGRMLRKFAWGEKTLNNFNNALGNFFYSTLPHFVKTMGYVFSLKWIWGKKPPKSRVEQDRKAEKAATPEAKPVKWGGRPGTDPGIAPLPNVVWTQLAIFADSDNAEHAAWGQRFNKLSPTAQEYMSRLAIKRWWDRPPGDRERLLTEDPGWSEGMLPRGFLTKYFITSYLTSDKELKTREASAEAWATQQKKTIPKSVASESQFKPRWLIVVDQLVHDERYRKLDNNVQNYLAKKAIAKWYDYSAKVRQIFVDPEDAPDRGILPHRFVEMFLEAELKDPEATRRQAFAFAQMIKHLPELDAFPFDLLDNRADVLLSRWEILPQAIKGEFWLIDGLDPVTVDRHRLPKSFIDYMRPLLAISTKARKSLEPMPEPFDISAGPNLTYEGFELKPIMNDLASLNPELAKYPEVLKFRANSIVDRWRALPKEIQLAFINQDADQGEEIGRPIPKSFINFLYQTPTVGKDPRAAVATRIPQTSRKGGPNDDDPEDRGGGKGGTPPPAGPAGADSGTPAGSPQQDAKPQSTSRGHARVSLGSFWKEPPAPPPKTYRPVSPAALRKRRARNHRPRGPQILTGAQKLFWPWIGTNPTPASQTVPSPIGVVH